MVSIRGLAETKASERRQDERRGDCEIPHFTGNEGKMRKIGLKIDIVSQKGV